MLLIRTADLFLSRAHFHIAVIKLFMFSTVCSRGCSPYMFSTPLGKKRLFFLSTVVVAVCGADIFDSLWRQLMLLLREKCL